MRHAACARQRRAIAVVAAAFVVSFAAAAPSVYPTGTTIYDPARAWNGYTVLTPLAAHGTVVIDMNGNLVKQWPEFVGSSGGPARILPGGIAVGAGPAQPQRQESVELIQRDFAGNVTWRFDRGEQVPSADGGTTWSARQHHDWQRDDFPAGYYSPEATPAAQGVKTLLLTHTTVTQAKVAAGNLEDDRIIEVDWDGKLLWEWRASDHIDELGFSPEARTAIANARGGRGGPAAGGPAAGRGGPAAGGAGPAGPRGAAPGGAAGPGAGRGAVAGGPAAGRGAGPGGRGGARGGPPAGFDWLHINSATYVGPNRWFDAGDTRFAPDNVIISSRQANIVAIVARDGSIAWRLGPDFNETAELRAIRQIIGQHHAHVIPKGLPGAGNVLIFDNGGSGGYGFPNPTAPNGANSLARASSRVVEIDPVAMRLVWSYTAGANFFSTNISGAQRLANGNTLITEGAPGRIFEVTSDSQIVWEYMSPWFGQGARPTNSIYRAYRLPYDWIPQLAKPQEKAITPPALAEFKLPQ